MILVRRRTFSARDEGTFGWWCLPRREADVHLGRMRNQGLPSTQVSFGLVAALGAALASGSGKVSLHETKLVYTVGIWRLCCPDTKPSMVTLDQKLSWCADMTW